MKEQNICEHELKETSICVDGFDGDGNRVGFEHKELRCKKCGYTPPICLDGVMKFAKGISGHPKTD